MAPTVRMLKRLVRTEWGNNPGSDIGVPLSAMCPEAGVSIERVVFDLFWRAL